MKTCCCSSHCKKYFDCQLADINNEGINFVENYHEYGSGTFTDEGCVTEHYCGGLGNYKMFEPIESNKKVKIVCAKCNGAGHISYYDEHGVWTEFCSQCGGMGILESRAIDDTVEEMITISKKEYEELLKYKLKMEELNG